MSTEPLEIQLLGGFQIRRGSRVIPDDAWKLRKAAGIVKLLALAPDHRLHREQVLDTLWPELEPEAAANNLRYALHTARQILNPERVDADRLLFRESAHLVLAEPEMIWVDVREFENALEIAWHGNDPAPHRVAAKLYTGDLLPDDRYEAWLDARRTALRTSYLALLARLARLYKEGGERDAAIEVLRQMVATEPAQEETHAELMLLYASGGQRREALAQYDLLVHTLKSELEFEPDPVTQQLAGAIRDGTFTTMVKPDRAKRRSIRSNLPAQPTDLVGREREIAQLQQELARSRLVTVTGPGGVGKTRLALAVADTQREQVEHGVFFVALAPLNDPELVVATIIQALGIRETGGRPPLDLLSEFLADRTLLLVLDNFEHVVAAAPLVSTLLQQGPQLRILVTSRVPLRVRGEQEYPLRPLALPDVTRATDPESLQYSAATTLFTQRSREVKPDFAINSTNAVIVAEICRRLDGLPLAIELAAARSKVLPPHALLSRLEHPLELLTGGHRDLPERQRTLRDTIAWSYELLQPPEQSFFRALAVTAGGWTLELAEAVSENGLNPLETLTALVESSLVDETEGRDGEPRFWMLETIREFGLERLAASGEEHYARERHAHYVLDLVEAVEPLLDGLEMVAWLDRLDQEHANIRAALDWFMLSSNIEAALRMAGLLWQFWWMRGHWTIGGRYYDTLLPKADDTIQPATLAGALTGAGIMAIWDSDIAVDRAQVMSEQALSIGLSLPDPPFHIFWNYVMLGYVAVRCGDLQAERKYFETMLDVATRLDSTNGVGMAFHNLARSALGRGDLEHAIEQFHEALRYFGSVGSIWGTNVATGGLGRTLLLSGRYDEARTQLEKALAMNQLMGHTRDVAMCMNSLGVLELHEGRLTEAVELLDRGLTIAQDIGDREIIAEAKLGLGNIARRHGTTHSATQLFRESLQGALSGGDVTGVAAAVEGLAAVSNDDGDPQRAAQLYASAAAYREATGAKLAGIQRAEMEEGLGAVQRALPEAEFAAAWGAGLQLTPDQIS